MKYCITIAASSPPALVFFSCIQFQLQSFGVVLASFLYAPHQREPHDVEKRARGEVNEVISEFLNRSDVPLYITCTFQSDRLLDFLSLKLVVQGPAERENGK